MAETSIEWCDYTFNPVEGCQRVSPGCVNCYAERKNKWLKGGKNWGPGSPRLARSEAYWRQPNKWNSAAVQANVAADLAGRPRPARPRVFCASVADVFEDHPDWVAPRLRLFNLIDETPHLDWLLLTKRPENIGPMLPSWRQHQAMWPNVWLGTTVEDQQRANERVDHLVAVPAAVHFLSVEPQLEAVDLCRWLFCEHCGYSKKDQALHGDHRICEARTGAKVPTGIDWVICGGESGTGVRPFDVEWARSLRDQCARADVAFFMKQLGQRTRMLPADVGGDPELPPMIFPMRKGEAGDPRTWPADLRVRQFPEVRHA